MINRRICKTQTSKKLLLTYYIINKRDFKNLKKEMIVIIVC